MAGIHCVKPQHPKELSNIVDISAGLNQKPADFWLPGSVLDGFNLIIGSPDVIIQCTRDDGWHSP